MDLTFLQTIKSLFKQRGILPSRRLGQNFLVDRGAIGKIVGAAELNSDDIVLEIGPGLGVLTQELAKRTKKVIAVEKDPNMINILEETLEGISNVEIIHGDIGRSDLLISRQFREVGPLNFKVVGNLPFYLTAFVIRRFLELYEARLHTGPVAMVLVVQKEVAQRICAKPPDMNLLAVSVQFYADPKIISYISKESFWPSPEVDAAIIKITPFNSGFQKSPKFGEISEIDKSLFFKIAKAGFSQPRKQLINNLSKGLKIDKKKTGEWLLKNGVQPSQRAETLTINDWARLTKGLVSPPANCLDRSLSITY